MTIKHTLTGDLRDLGLDAVDGRAMAWLATNLPNGTALIDYDANQVVLRGRKRIPLTGSTFTMDLIATDSTGINVPADSLRYGVYVDHWEDGHSSPVTVFSGWFTLTADADLATKINSDIAPLVDLTELEQNAAITSLIVEATEGHTPGSEMAYAEVAYGAGGSQVYPTLYHWSPLLLTVVGQGRPVDIEWVIPQAYHSVANTGIAASMVSQKNAGALVTEQVLIGYSPKTTEGPPMVVRRRKVLDAGATYTFAFYMAGMAAGNWAAGGGGGVRTMHTSVVSR